MCGGWCVWWLVSVVAGVCGGCHVWWLVSVVAGVCGGCHVWWLVSVVAVMCGDWCLWWLSCVVAVGVWLFFNTTQISPPPPLLHQSSLHGFRAHEDVQHDPEGH